jgi:hypothetical protein
MVPPTANLGPGSERRPRAPGIWLEPERQARLRAILVGIVMAVGLAVWVFHSIVVFTQRSPEFVHRLRVVGVMTWLYALIQLVDMRFYQSRFARRRHEQLKLPENILGWLLAQMAAWFGIVYYALTQDLRWYAAGLVLVALAFAVFPIVTRERH